MRMRRRFTALLPLLVAPLSPTAALEGQRHQQAAGGPQERLGSVEFQISCNAEAQVRFGRALALLHSFWWPEAARAFDAVAEADPTCAMAYWGKALVHRGNWFAGLPSPDAAGAGLAAAERAAALNAPTERERGYVAAVRTLFADAETNDYASRARAYEEEMRQLQERHPDDPEAAIFYALAVSANTPASDRSFERQKRAGTILEALLDERPDHPGLAHYMIHTYDTPATAHLGQAAALRYGEIALSVPHAQHMPSHIFTRLGMWDESIRANNASAESALAYERAEGMTDVSFDRAHAWDYLAYAHLQKGQDALALAVLDDVRNSSAEPSIATDYAFAAIPARYALERGRWGEAASLPVRSSPGFRAGEAISHFARGLGAARSGDPGPAGEEVRALAGIRDALRQSSEAYWSEAVEAQRLAVAGWIAHARGLSDDALRLIREAAEIEKRIDKHPVAPGPIVAASELLGDLLLEINRPAEAQQAYVAALESEPNRARLVFGAARAAELAGDTDAARTRYTEYLRLMAAADGGREELDAANAFVARSR
ncbi:MAG: hypothetical protein WD766_11405 [Gemmatimonadota bacterium]